MTPRKPYWVQRMDALRRLLRGHGQRPLFLLVIASLLLLTACAAPIISAAKQPRASATATLPAKWRGGNLAVECRP